MYFIVVVCMIDVKYGLNCLGVLYGIVYGFGFVSLVVGICLFFKDENAFFLALFVLVKFLLVVKLFLLVFLELLIGLFLFFVFLLLIVGVFGLVALFVDVVAFMAFAFCRYMLVKKLM